MTRSDKLRYHLEMIIWETLPEGQRMTAAQSETLMQMASPDQHHRAYQRALIFVPMLLEEER